MLQQGNCPRQTRQPRHSHGSAASTLAKNHLKRSPVLVAAASDRLRDVSLAGIAWPAAGNC